MTTPEESRHSVAENAPLVSDPEERARREAANSLVQAKRVRDMTLDALHGDRKFRLRPSILLELNRCAIDGLDAYAGNWRPAGIGIQKSKHEPPGAHQVPELVEDMCDYVNDQLAEERAIHASAFTMWRLNWIHPFTDGNGRTSRAASYLVLCVGLDLLLPGSLDTIPAQIERNKAPYYEALEAADASFRKSGITAKVVIEMEQLLESMLAAQLAGVHQGATQVCSPVRG